MEKIYQKHTSQLSGKEIVMPQKPSNSLGDILDNVSKTTRKLSEENFKLGKAQLINSVLAEAYNQAPENPKLFNELVQTGFQKSLSGLDDTTKEKIFIAANDTVKQYQIKVGNNLNARLDRENSEKVMQLANDALYGQTGVKETNKLIADMLASGKNVSREEIDGLVNQRNRAIARLKAFAQAKNIKGGFILGDKSIRKAIETENFEMSNTILDSISYMDYESLKSYDEKYFQDKKGFEEKTGLNLKDYKTLSEKIKKRRKELNKEDERIINDQSKYNVLSAALQNNPALLEDQKEYIPEEIYKKFKNIMEKPTLKSDALVTNEDASFLKQFDSVLSIANTEYNGNENFNNEFLEKYVDALDGLKKYREKYNTSDSKDEITDAMLYNAAVDNLYSQVLGNIEETSIFGQIVKTAESIKAESKGNGKIRYGYEENLQREKYETPYMARVATVLPSDPNPEETIASQRRIGNIAVMQIAQIGNMMRMTQDEEYRQGLYNQAVDIIKNTNREMLKVKMKPLIATSDFDRCVKELEAGGKPLFVSPRNKRTYHFAGITNNEIIIADEQ